MKIETIRAKEIDAYVSNPQTFKDEPKLRVELAGQVHSLQVYRIPIKLLIYNIRNGRFAAELLEKERELNRRLDPTVHSDAKLIQKLLLNQNETETKVLKEDLRKNLQLEPGIITTDGAVINANRRMAILSQLYEETHEPRFEYLRVARLPRQVDEKDLWRIEAGLQFARDFRLEYGGVNELLKLKEGRKQGLLPEDISKSLLGRYTSKQVEDKLEILELIGSYLEFIGRPGEYYFVQDQRNLEKFNSLYGSVIAPARRQGKKEVETVKLIETAFLLIQKTDLTHWNIRELKKISINNNALDKLIKPLKGVKRSKISGAILKDAFKSAREIVEDQEDHDKPTRLIDKALNALRSIDPMNVKLKEAHIRKLLAEAASVIDNLIKSHKR